MINLNTLYKQSSESAGSFVETPSKRKYAAMSFFWSIRIHLPADFYDDLPGVGDAWMDEVLAAEHPLPEESDLDISKIDQPYVELGERIKREMLLEWSYRSGKYTPYYMQLEKTENGHHMHCMMDNSTINSFVLGRYIPSLKQRIAKNVFGGITPTRENWLDVRKTKPQGGSNKAVHVSFINNYLVPKTQSELQWAWSDIEEYKSLLLNAQLRKEFFERWQQEALDRSAENPREESRTLKSKNTERYMALVNWLVENGITSEKEWIKEDQESYLSYNAASNSRSQIKAALENAAKIMTLSKTAEDYLVGKQLPADITANRVYQIFQLNGYDPALAGSILLGWARRQFGKRNAVWLYGPATTGKTNIAEAIAHAVPFYGCVNWTNENFPFNDCVDKMLIWWEEGKMTAKIVESAKSILGGSRVRVDQKCKSSQQIDSTPVIITSNTDMTIVVDGNAVTMEHRQPLEDRMFQFYLGRRLDNDFGKITKQEVREFFKWAELNKVPAPHVFKVPTTSGDPGYKRKREEPAPSVAAATLKETDAPIAAPEEPEEKRPRYELSETVDNSGEEYRTLLDKVIGPMPPACVVHDQMDAGACVHGKHLFCAECGKIAKLECPDSNKEQ